MISKTSIININKAQIICALLIFSIFTKAQNLVPNYSFELTTNCAVSSGDGGATDWYSPVINNSFYTYSYANSCSSTACCSVPSNGFGGGWQYLYRYRKGGL